MIFWVPWRIRLLGRSSLALWFCLRLRNCIREMCADLRRSFWFSLCAILRSQFVFLMYLNDMFPVFFAVDELCLWIKKNKRTNLSMENALHPTPILVGTGLQPAVNRQPGFRRGAVEQTRAPSVREQTRNQPGGQKANINATSHAAWQSSATCWFVACAVDLLILPWLPWKWILFPDFSFRCHFFALGKCPVTLTLQSSPICFGFENLSKFIVQYRNSAVQFDSCCLIRSLYYCLNVYLNIKFSK